LNPNRNTLLQDNCVNIFLTSSPVKIVLSLLAMGLMLIVSHANTAKFQCWSVRLVIGLLSTFYDKS